MMLAMSFGINKTANLKKLLLQRTLRNVETYEEINTHSSIVGSHLYGHNNGNIGCRF